MENNNWFGFVQIGVNFDYVRNITFDNNVIAHVVGRVALETGDELVDLRGGLVACQYLEMQKCYDLSITNNIVAGITYAGFIVPGHTCGDSDQKVFRGNVAHSIKGFMGGIGALIYPD